MSDQPASHGSETTDAIGRYFLPTLATITALCFMAVASAAMGVWRDVSVMRESVKTLVAEITDQKASVKTIKEQVQEHEVRITKGGL